uniref:Uncharacterized protein n=1 Tax=Anguilla anguilla TaxID=7936 RepID=A0A0E9TKX9_ANGAN
MAKGTCLLPIKDICCPLTRETNYIIVGRIKALFNRMIFICFVCIARSLLYTLKCQRSEWLFIYISKH